MPIQDCAVKSQMNTATYHDAASLTYSLPILLGKLQASMKDFTPILKKSFEQRGHYQVFDE